MFVGANRDPDARPDPFFDSAGQKLVANLLLAAALDDRPMTQALLWITRPNDDEPALILARARPHARRRVRADHVHSPLSNAAACSEPPSRSLVPARPRDRQWVTPAPTPTAPPSSTSTRSCRAATPCTCSPRGRLQRRAGDLADDGAVRRRRAARQALARRAPAVPLVGVLDEAANMCRWRQLPDLYSHYGSRWICLMTMLQSWSQGVEVWGREGMRKLWSAANIRVYGGGVAEQDFLSTSRSSSANTTAWSPAPASSAPPPARARAPAGS